MAHYSLDSKQAPHETSAAPGPGAILWSCSLKAIVIHSMLWDFYLGKLLFRSLTVDTSTTTTACVILYHSNQLEELVALQPRIPSLVGSSQTGPTT